MCLKWIELASNNIYVMFMWTVETLDGLVDRELARLPRDLVARFMRISELLEAHGPDTVGMPHVRCLSGTGKLWEMRMSGKTVSLARST